ncbi:META domain-containing protein [Spirosoma arcticum]
MRTLQFPRQTKTLLAYSLALCTLLTTYACQEQSATPSPDSSTISAADYRAMRVSFTALEGDWWLTTYQNASLPQHLQNKAWLRLTKESADVLRMGGVGFPNHYGGTFRLDEAKGLVVLTDPIFQTLIGGSEEQMKAEGRFLDALSKAKTFELTDNGQLKIYTGEKGNPATEVLVFTKK